MGQNLGLPIHAIPRTRQEFKTWQVRCDDLLTHSRKG